MTGKAIGVANWTANEYQNADCDGNYHNPVIVLMTILGLPLPTPKPTPAPTPDPTSDPDPDADTDRPRRPTPAPDDRADRHAGADRDAARIDTDSDSDDPADADPGTDGQRSTRADAHAGRVDPERAAGVRPAAAPSARVAAGPPVAAPRPTAAVVDPDLLPEPSSDVGQRDPLGFAGLDAGGLDRRRRLRVGRAGRDPGRTRPAPDAAHRGPGGGRTGLAAARPAEDRIVRSGAPSTGVRRRLDDPTGSGLDSADITKNGR